MFMIKSNNNKINELELMRGSLKSNTTHSDFGKVSQRTVRV
jgi:hypothetical protein